MKIHRIAFVLLIIAGLNWLLEAFGVGIGRFLPESIAMIIYILVGLAAVYEIFSHKKLCRDCGTRQGAPMQQ